MLMSRRILFCFCFLVLASTAIVGQVTTSTLLGTLTDSSGAVVAGGKLQLVESGTGASRTAESNSVGLFRFLNLPPGAYVLTTNASGFKARVDKGIMLTSSETRDLGRLLLEVGQISDQVTVTAETTPVQVATAEKSALVDSNTLSAIALKGRDMFAMMGLVAGIVDTGGNRDASTQFGINGVNVNGQSYTKNNVTVDGVSNMDLVAANSIHYEPNMDSVAEVKVLTSSFQAEYGRNSGGTISIVTKGGTRDLHATGWWNGRNEALNATDFFQNKNAQPKPKYRYNVVGYSVGGPIFIPHKFNSGRNKLFFFASQEYTMRMASSSTKYALMPTAAERTGDFSQSFDQNGKLITIKDPNNGVAFAGNKIPADRINSLGFQVLDWFPLPNGWVNPNPSFKYTQNFVANANGSHPRRNDMLRFDTYLTSKLSGYFRWIRDHDIQDIPLQAAPFNYALMQTSFPGHGYGSHLTYTFSPTLVNEFTFGKEYELWGNIGYMNNAEMTRGAKITRADKGGATVTNPDLPRIYPMPSGSWIENYMAAVSFGTTNPTGAVSLNSGASNGVPMPFANWTDTWQMIDSLSKVWGRHTIKAGVTAEYAQFYMPQTNAYFGTYNFQSSTQNPYDSGHGYANALLGNFYSYSDFAGRVLPTVSYWDVEPYVQDNFRVASRLTLDLGVRVYRIGVPTANPNTSSQFDPSLWNAASAARLYWPAMVNAKRVAQDVVTGATGPAVLIGAYVPGSGNFANGMRVLGKDGAPRSPFSFATLLFAPRAGIAWDVFGDGKTAVRTGFGIFFNRPTVGAGNTGIGSPPISYSSTVYYSNLNQVASGFSSTAPTTSSFYKGRQPIEYSMNGSFGIQQSIGFHSVLDVSYVGNFARHSPVSRQLNPVPMFARFDLANLDPTTGTYLTDNFLRKNYPGMGTISITEFSTSSLNYHSMQSGLRRRMTTGLMFGVSYTFSKGLGTTGNSIYFPARQRNYGVTSTDRRQVMAINYSYDLPKLGAMLNSRPLSIMLDHWTWSGVTKFQSGAPFWPTCTSSVSGTDITGSDTGEPLRCNLIGDAGAGARSFYSAFNTAAFALPSKGSFGNLGGGSGGLNGRGVSNFDMTLASAFPIGMGEKHPLEFRAEFYNIFNHTQFTSIDSAGQYNASGVQVKTTYGQYTAALPARIISGTLRIRF